LPPPRARDWKHCGTTSSPNTLRPSRRKPPNSAPHVGDLSADWKKHAADFIAKTNEKAETIATRKASQNCINGLAPALPEFLGGSADLTGSNLTNWTGWPSRQGQEHRQLHQLRRARIRMSTS